MTNNTSTDAHSRPLRVFLCHDLRDKQETVYSDGRREKGIVLQLTEWLEDQHCAVWRSDKELFAGVAWEPKIFDQAIPTCDLFVICLTENFVEKTDGERHHEVIVAQRVAVNKHPDPDNTFIIPVRIHHVQYPGFKDKQYINYYKEGNFEKLGLTVARKRQQLEGHGHALVQTMPRRSSSPSPIREVPFEVWNVPHLRNPHFTGREELLDQLEQHLFLGDQEVSGATRRAALTQTQAIKGLGGIGKTQIAVEYAYRSRELGRYTHTLWVNAASEEALITNFTTLAELLPEFPAKDEVDQHKLVKEIKHWLEQCQHQWLLVFDNVDSDDSLSQLANYFPQQGPGSILLTTRSHAVGSLGPLAVSINVEEMDRWEGTLFLLRRAQLFEHTSILDASDEEDEMVNAARGIVDALESFPLALDQAGAYIEETKCNLADYLQIYQDHRKDLLARRGKQTTNYPDSVATTWSLSFKKVERANPAASDLLRLCAFLAPDQIPEELIKEGAAYWPSLLQQASADLFAFDQMIGELLKFSLIKRLAEDHVLSIHRLVQAVQRDWMESEAQLQWAERVVLAVSEVFPHNPEDSTTWSQCLRYLDQAQTCNILIEQFALPLIEAVSLLKRAGSYLNDHASYTIAEPLLQHALTICEHQLGATHPATASSLNDLAALYYSQGKYREAEPLYQRALATHEQQLGATHPNTLLSLNNLAQLYQAQGRNEEAEPLYQRALATYEQQSGATHSNAAGVLNNLAVLYKTLGKYTEAELLYQRALAIYEQQLGATPPSTAQVLNNLAILYETQEKYAEAEPLCQRALTIYEQHLEARHPDTTISLNNLVRLYQKQGKHELAESLYQRALSIYEQQLGSQHPNTQIVRENYLSLLQARDETNPR